MAVELNHTIVPAHDPQRSAQFLAGILGLPVDPPVAHFTPVTLPAASPARSMPARTATAAPISATRTAPHGNPHPCERRAGISFLTLKSFLPGMKERRRGTIITIGSAAGRRAHPRSPIPYAAAKAGIALLTQDVAAQAGPFGIRVNCITPETILTEGNQDRIPAELQASLADAHPLKRLGTPQDVATAAAFLASDQAAWITGVVVDVAGGAVLV